MSKYHAQPTVYKGIKFKSKLESKVARTLDVLGYYWEYEPTSILVPGRAGVVYSYRPDFLVNYNGEGIYLEVKGYKQGLQKLRAYAKGHAKGELKTPLYITTRFDLKDMQPVEQYLEDLKQETKAKNAYNRKVKEALTKP